jgi:hypothetical protein
MNKPPNRRCKVCGKRYRDYFGEKFCKRPECKKDRVALVNASETVKSTQTTKLQVSKEEAPIGFAYPKTKKDPLVARLEKRARQKRWEAKQAPSTLKAIKVHGWKAYSTRKLKEDPNWQKKRYRKYRDKILPRARIKAKERYHRLKNEGKK